MKNFFTSMLGSLAALGIFAFGSLLLFLGLLGAIIALGAHKAPSHSIEAGSYLVFDLSANITDAPPAFDLSQLYSAADADRTGTLQLRTVTRALQRAAGDSRIAGVLLKGSVRPAGYGSGYAALREVRAALRLFRDSGKPVKAYLTDAEPRDYYLASVANEVTLDPFGTLMLPGLASNSPYFAGALAKYGIDVQVTRVGKYKSAVEPFTRTDMSPEAREEAQLLFNEIWHSLLAEVALSRHLTIARIQSTVDAQGLILPEAARQAGLVDRVADRDAVVDELKAATGRTGGNEPFKQIGLGAYARLVSDPANRSSSNAVAVVYAEGEIVDGQGRIGEVGGEKFAAELRRLREDDSVKAVVLRVNSPGGSAEASEVIQREVKRVREKKPVIISMGTYAASGGYWISAYADRVFAEPTTITGSIGVFGLQFDIQRLAANWGVTFDGVKTGRFAGADTITRPKTPEEMAVVQRLVDWLYGQFILKVSDGRKLDRGFVEGIAQGRVWSGLQARKLGLIDDFGGLQAAIQYAAQRAKVGSDYRLVEFPRRQDLAQAIGEILGRLPADDASAPATGLAAQVSRQVQAGLSTLESFNDPRGAYARLPLEFEIK
jgi:protease-4